MELFKKFEQIIYASVYSSVQECY